MGTNCAPLALRVDKISSCQYETHGKKYYFLCGPMVLVDQFVCEMTEKQEYKTKSVEETKHLFPYNGHN